MSDLSKNKIFTPTDCISEQTIFDYIDNKLSTKERHAMEKHLVDCDLCSDALEGLEIVKDRNRIGLINQKINERIAPIVNKKKIIKINYRAITAVAAGLLLLIGSVFLFKEFTSTRMEEKNVADMKKPAPLPLPAITNEPNATDSINFASPITKNKEVQSEIKKNAKPLAFKLQEKIKANSNTTASNKAGGIASFPTTDKNSNAIVSDEKMDESVDKAAPSIAASTAVPKSAEYKTNETEKRSRSVPYQKEKAEQYIPTKNASVDRTIESDSIYTVADEMPEFPGGQTELMKYVQKNIQSSSPIVIEIIIDKTGKAIGAKLLNPYSKELEKQIVEMVNKMPKWNPGKQNGKAVSVRYNLPVKF